MYYVTAGIALAHFASFTLMICQHDSNENWYRELILNFFQLIRNF